MNWRAVVRSVATVRRVAGQRLGGVGFVNYVRSPTRDSPVNLGVARVLVATFLLWKTVWYNWPVVLSMPILVPEPYVALIPSSPWVMVAEQVVLTTALVCVLVGYRLRYSAFVAAATLSHTAVVRTAYNGSGGETSLFVAAYFLMFFALYAEQDVLTVDALYRRGVTPRETLTQRRADATAAAYRADALRWSLLAVSLVYFGVGVNKLLGTGLHWGTSEVLSRFLVVRMAAVGLPFSLAPQLVAHPWLVGIGAVSTLVLEVGFVVAVVAGVGITAWVLGLVGFHLFVIVTMGIVFSDSLVFLATFFTWDVVVHRLWPVAVATTVPEQDISGTESD